MREVAKEFSPLATRVVAIIATLNIIGFVYAMSFLYFKGYLPAPYLHVSDATFMDFYYSNWFAYHDVRYTEWGSIYPIFSYAVAYLTTPSVCYVGTNENSAYGSRDGCDPYSLCLMLAVALFAAYLNARLFSKKALMRALCFIAIAFSYPFLFAIERGNYILYTYAFLVFAVSARTKFAEGFFLACAINYKQYLVILLAYTLRKTKYDVLLVCLVSTVVLTVGSVLYLSEPNYLQLLDNMFAFTDPVLLGGPHRIPYALSVDQFYKFTQTPDADYWIDTMLRSEYPFVDTQFLISYFGYLKFFVVAMVAVVVLRVVQLREKIGEAFICFASLVCLLAVSEVPTLYALILLLPYLPCVYSLLSRKELFALFVLFQPFDATFLKIYEFTVPSYFSGEFTVRSLDVYYGTYFRPIAMLVLLLCLVYRVLFQSSSARHLGYDGQVQIAVRPS